MPILALLLLLMPISTSYAQSFTLMSWNMQWLSLNSTSPVVRSEADYQALQQIFTSHSPDILAFQEVDSVAALYRVINRQHYNIYFSSRMNNHQDSFKKNNQYTGFAVKKAIVVDNLDDLSQLSTPTIATGGTAYFNNKLRYGSVINIIIDNQPITLLNLHLKSGCFSGKQLAQQQRRACKTLAQQLKLIKQWIHTQQAVSTALIIVGDFNHRITSNHNFINKITDNPIRLHHISASIKANCTVKLATKVSQYRTYTNLIDHLFATTNVKVLSQHQIQYNKQQLSQFTLSDHCPLLFRLVSDYKDKK
ncbi:endonuclease/exonuclease/phosphatase family protein [Photobacterium sp. Alg240-V54]|uniref:endonuclease/exonuclease/phosphatase family protein n=1 Tax=Photobacterium sp. Alg240-V54 TaxID=2305995 RepID=UPI0013D54D82|nr:endonuclease/exonuclease/phosphatase family protein [Photobacterium sp. Alg240-V54]